MNTHPKVYTFSIVAYDPKNKCWGVAAASKFLAVGALVPFAKAEVGAIATQSSVNTAYGVRGLELLAKGFKASKVLEILLKEDKLNSDRQVGIVDRWGNIANYTGSECSPWAGGMQGKHLTAQGNLLGSKNTLTAMVGSFEKTTGRLEQRLYAALVAGERAGGDKRGKQSASLLVVKHGGSYGGHSDRYLDLRVDNHPEPVEELGELLKLHHIFLGSSDDDEKISFDNKLIKEFQELLKKLGYYSGPVSGDWDQATQTAILRFADIENLEQRVDINKRCIDWPALEYIRLNFKH
jgi:uncharacterized Ntn-hydrolase superfamily protein